MLTSRTMPPRGRRVPWGHWTGRRRPVCAGAPRPRVWAGTTWIRILLPEPPQNVVFHSEVARRRSGCPPGKGLPNHAGIRRTVGLVTPNSADWESLGILTQTPPVGDSGNVIATFHPSPQPGPWQEPDSGKGFVVRQPPAMAPRTRSFRVSARKCRCLDPRDAVLFQVIAQGMIRPPVAHDRGQLWITKSAACGPRDSRPAH